MSDKHRTTEQSASEAGSATKEACRRLVDAGLLQQYRTKLEDSIAEPPIAAEFERWKQYVRDRHGTVFDATEPASDVRADQGTDGTAVDDAAEQGTAAFLFTETVTFDFLLTKLLETLGQAFHCSVQRPLAADSAIQFEASFETVHEEITSTLHSQRNESTFHERASEFLASATPYDLAQLHRVAVSAQTRRAFGRYDTPGGIAELAVETAIESARDDGRNPDADSHAGQVILDSGCGMGAFLAAAAETLVARTQSDSPIETVRTVLDSVRGFDLSPTAVRASRLAVLLALRPALAALADTEVAAAFDEEQPQPPSEKPQQRRAREFLPQIVLGDAAVATAADQPLNGRRADALLLNPPWLTWDSLPEGIKRRWRTSTADDDPDLFDHRGLDARLGFANDDLSVPFTIRCLHRLLRDDGSASLVLKRDLLTGPAGRRLRRPEIGTRTLSYECAHDFGTLDPFHDVDAGTVLLGCRIGEASPTESIEPIPDGPTDIPTVCWSRSNAATKDSERSINSHDTFASLSAMKTNLDRTETQLVPTDTDEPGSAWIRADAEREALGSCAYEIRHGVKDDAKAVYAVDREIIEAHDLESDHVYPYLKSKHVVKYGLFGHDLQLVPQRRVNEDNEEQLRRETPATYAYLESYRDRLQDRGSAWFDDGPFYSLFGLGPYTWAPYKVVWCRLGFKPHFAVVSKVSDPIVGERPAVPGDHCMFIGTDDEREAHYLCALLNSAPYQRCLRDISSGGKSSLSKSTVQQLSLPEWTDSKQQQHLAKLSKRAHEVVPDHVDCSKREYNQKTIPDLAAVQTRIDRSAAQFLVTNSHGKPTDGSDE